MNIIAESTSIVVKMEIFPVMIIAIFHTEPVVCMTLPSKVSKHDWRLLS